jgi:rubrerythrin
MVYWVSGKTSENGLAQASMLHPPFPSIVLLPYENFEITEMYPTYIEVAKFQGEKGAQKSFEWAYGTGKKHKELYVKAKKAVDGERDVELGPIQVCEVCGYTLEGEAPDRCPLCGTTREKFTAFP